MSKIQKAFEELLTKPDVPEAGAARAPQPAECAMTADSLAVTGAQHSPSGLSLKRRLKVDVSSLIRAGLLPGQSDVEAMSDQFRRVKRPILRLAFEREWAIEANPNVIMVASALPGAGKSFCSFNLAQSIAMERDVGAILVDADVLKPNISKSLGLSDCPGLIDYLIDPSISLEDVLVATDLQDVLVLPAGRRHPEATELLASRRMKDLITLLSESFRNNAIVFDTPPLLITNEAQVLSERVGQIVLVIVARVSSQDSVSRALGLLDRDKPINALLNKSRSPNRAGHYSEYAYHAYPRSVDHHGTDES